MGLICKKLRLRIYSMDPKQLQIKDFTYTLPENRIAVYPLADRDASKLLVYKRGNISEDVYRNIARHLPEEAFLVLNDTRVVEARLLFQKATGGNIEIFCLAPHTQYADITAAMLQKHRVWWNCLIGGASKWKRGTVLEKKVAAGKGTIVVQASVAERLPDSFTVEMRWEPGNLSFAEVLHYAGTIPLPPYIKREADKEDEERYQTIYARQQGSVAAPTAGLHFTENIFQSLGKKHIEHDFVTLHVGAGTFKPVKSESMKDHVMHAEFMDVRYETIEKLLQSTGKIFCVGTTSLRTVESLYWMGVKLKRNAGLAVNDLPITQWEVYEELAAYKIPARESLKAVLKWMEQRSMKRLITQTRIIIAPGYDFNIISGLITNFHQPKSTLLLLVAAITGNDWEKVYRYGLENNFRFLSYGDGCLLFT
ncbi:S-adenosylmethionine:tRNA ribosyltransferase-isomerase [Agriterribacter sp.]|uniref:S-adenosylmethionine:tRNA ribosyltransferase-isomerase n=1 Tax=Agriterribacter sp. TaxID=2821509 RepID=UPI002CB92FCF|nr:S-adenosylmethionine:tRNA ribosyltransferase-isomerase [Agriterribacter sp.]HRP54944.1 S-adenosylmethionine:tRNA ribosyltransferase-isomerase [Agriterribacter sp.]